MNYVALKNAIESSGLNISDLCKKIPIDRTTFYSNIENRNMKIDVLEKICILAKLNVCDYLEKIETDQSILREPNNSYGQTLLKQAQELIKGIDILEKENRDLKKQLNLKMK